MENLLKHVYVKQQRHKINKANALHLELQFKNYLKIMIDTRHGQIYHYSGRYKYPFDNNWYNWEEN
jgi:hypothetical protein